MIWSLLTGSRKTKSGGCFSSMRRKDRTDPTAINARKVFLTEDQRMAIVAETPKISRSGPHIRKPGREPALVLSMHGVLKTTVELDESPPAGEPGSSTEAERPCGGCDNPLAMLQPALRRRYTLPLLSDFNLSVRSQGSFTSGFEEFPNFFTEGAIQHELSDTASFVTVCNPRVQSQACRQECPETTLDFVETRTRRAKSMGFIPTKEKQKLITIQRRGKQVVAPEETVAVKVQSTDSVSVVSARNICLPESPNPSLGITTSTLDLNKPLPSLPRPHQTVFTMKKRLSRIFHPGPEAPVDSITVTVPAVQARAYPNVIRKARPVGITGNPGIVGSKVELWEGMLAPLPRNSTTVVTRGRPGTANPVGKGSLESSTQGSRALAGRNSTEDSSSIAADDSEMTIIVRRECASESFTNLQLLSRPTSPQSVGELPLLSRPATPANCPSPINNRLIRSPGFVNLRKEAYSPQEAPSTPTPHSRHRVVKDTSWIGAPLSGSGANDHISVPERKYQPTSLPTSGTTGNHDSPIQQAARSHHFSFRVNFKDFMDESLHRYGRSGLGGKMMREMPVSESMEFIGSDRDSRIDPSTEKMIEIWGDVEVSSGGTILC